MKTNEEPDTIIDTRPSHRRSDRRSRSISHESATDTTQTEATNATLSRVARQQSQRSSGVNDHQKEVRHPFMRRRLNWAIFAVVVLIIAIYLVLFLV